MSRIIAPRLASGKSRVSYGGRLPDYVKDGLRRISEMENKSVSWTMEEIIIRYFKFKTPKYVERKKANVRTK